MYCRKFSFHCVVHKSKLLEGTTHVKRKRHIRIAATAAEDAISFHSASAPQPPRGNGQRNGGGTEAAAPVAEGLRLHLSSNNMTGQGRVQGWRVFQGAA